MLFSRTRYEDESPDRELIEKYRNSHDAGYVTELFRRYIHLLSVLSLKYLRNAADSEDAIMEIFEKVSRYLKQHEVKNFKSWIYSVTRNHCLKRIEKGDKVVLREDLVNSEREFMESGGDKDPVNIALEKEEQFQRLEKGINNLSEEQKRCIELFFLEEKSYKEVTEATGYSLNQVKSFIQNGKRNLKLFMNGKHG